MPSYKYINYAGGTCTQFVDKKLSDHASSKCGIKYEENGLYFYSYGTPVIHINVSGWLTCSGTYSNTTRRQIGWFLKEYAPGITYQDAKRSHERLETVNINTREWKSL